MELSMLCDQSISVIIYDKGKQKMVVYNSSEDFTPRTASDKYDLLKMNTNDNKFESYVNKDYSHFAAN